MKRLAVAATAAGMSLLLPAAATAAQRTGEDPMIEPVDSASGWTNTPIWTVGETVKGYTPPGIPTA